jgi:hypothetical protein
MSPILREKFSGQKFENFAHLVQRVSAFNGQLRTMHKEKYLKCTAAMSDPYNVDSDEDDLEVAAGKWTWGKTPVSCPWVKETESANDFDIKKAIRSLICYWKRSS